MRSYLRPAFALVLAFIPPVTASADPSLNLGLFTATYQNDAAAIAKLFAAGAEPNARSKYGGTPLHQAASKGHLSVINALLAAGADPSAKDRDGETPLDDLIAILEGLE